MQVLNNHSSLEGIDLGTAVNAQQVGTLPTGRSTLTVHRPCTFGVSVVAISKSTSKENKPGLKLNCDWVLFCEGCIIKLFNMDNWSEIQKISTDSRAGTKQLSTSQASQFLKLVSLVDLFKLMTKAVVEGPSITASTISSALLAITTSPPVLDSPSLLDALQRHQLEALSPTSHPRVSRAVLEHVREFVECSHVSTERKLAFFMGHGAPMIAFPTAILRSVVHEDVDVYTAAAKAVKAVMTLDDGSLSTSQEKIFKGVFVLVRDT